MRGADNALGRLAVAKIPDDIVGTVNGCGEVIEKNPKVVADFKAGKQNAMQFLAGHVMAVTRGTANPGKVHEMLKKLL